MHAPSTRLRWRRILLAALLLYLAVLGVSRLRLAVQDWSLLQSLGARPGPLYLAVSGGAWAAAALAAAGLTFAQAPWAGRAVFGAVLALAAGYWLDFLALTRAAEMMGNWPFALAVTLLGLLFCAWVTRPWQERGAHGASRSGD